MVGIGSNVMRGGGSGPLPAKTPGQCEIFGLTVKWVRKREELESSLHLHRYTWIQGKVSED